jgi:hypothetical protein
VPEAKLSPPETLAYQLIVPAEEVAFNSTVPFPHLLFGVTLVIVGRAFTVATTGVLEVEVQLFDVAST